MRVKLFVTNGPEQCILDPRRITMRSVCRSMGHTMRISCERWSDMRCAESPPFGDLGGSGHSGGNGDDPSAGEVFSHGKEKALCTVAIGDSHIAFYGATANSTARFEAVLGYVKYGVINVVSMVNMVPSTWHCICQCVGILVDVQHARHTSMWSNVGCVSEGLGRCRDERFLICHNVSATCCIYTRVLSARPFNLEATASAADLSND